MNEDNPTFADEELSTGYPQNRSKDLMNEDNSTFANVLDHFFGP